MAHDPSEIQHQLRLLMETHGVSFDTGFLAERPLRWLPKDAGNAQQAKDFMRLVDDFIGQFGEGHGTGKPPLEWLSELYKKAKSYLIEL